MIQMCLLAKQKKTPGENWYSWSPKNEVRLCNHSMFIDHSSKGYALKEWHVRIIRRHFTN